MAQIKIPTPLRPYTENSTEVAVEGTTAGEAVQDLVTQYPQLKPHLFDGGGELRPFVNLFLGENNIKDLQNLDTPVNPEDRLLLVPSIAGGGKG